MVQVSDKKWKEIKHTFDNFIDIDICICNNCKMPYRYGYICENCGADNIIYEENDSVEHFKCDDEKEVNYIYE